MPDQEFAAFLDYMARMSVLTGFYFSWGTVNDCIRLRISGGGEVAIALHERNPKIEAIRMEPSLLARVASLPASERAGVVDFIAELSKDRKIRSIDKERMDTIIATVRTGQPDVIRAVGRIFSMIGSNQIWILPEDLGKEAFQTMMIRIADSAKGLDLSIPEGSYKSSPERDKAFRQARTGVIVARRLTRDGTDTKQAMARLDGYLRAVDTLMDRPTSDGVAEALSVLGLGELRKFDPTHRARYEELFDIFTLDLSNTIAKNIDYSGTPGSLSTVMADTSTPKDTLEGYFNYLDKKDRLTLPEDIARRISAEAASGTIVVTPRNMALVGEFVQRLGDIRTQASAGSPVFEEERVDMPALVARLFPHRQWNMGASPEALYSSVMSMIRLDMDEGGIRDISALHRLMKLRGAWEPASSGRDRSSGRAASVF